MKLALLEDDGRILGLIESRTTPMKNMTKAQMLATMEWLIKEERSK